MIRISMYHNLRNVRMKHTKYYHSDYEDTSEYGFSLLLFRKIRVYFEINNISNNKSKIIEKYIKNNISELYQYYLLNYNKENQDLLISIIVEKVINNYNNEKVLVLK